MQISVPAHVSFLWSTKIKSRASFLLIIEFINLSRREIGIFICFLSKTKGFIEHYIAKSFQFIKHDFEELNPINLDQRIVFINNDETEACFDENMCLVNPYSITSMIPKVG